MDPLRHRLIVEATRQFVERGFAGTSMREIADACGVTKAALYYHFPSKADLLLDTLAGTEVHVVITARRPDAERHELADLVARWSAAVGDPARVHVLVAPGGIAPEGWIWHRLGELVGFDAAQLSLGGTRPPAYLRRAEAPLLAGRPTGQPTGP